MGNRHNLKMIGSRKAAPSLGAILMTAFFLVTLTVGCASQGNVPIEDRAAPPSRRINTHVVERGDTLYSIAWRYEKDFRELARINRIPQPYVIYIGQRLKLSGSVVAQESNTSSRSGSPSTATSTPSRPVATTTRANSPPPSVSRSSTTSTPTPSVPSGVPDNVRDWNWPAEGRVVTAFGSSELTKGITLETTEGTEVKAAADGVVVYAGSGVRGYGNFLILKHSDLFLSAYAYNSELLANEGDRVVQGQRIARSGKDMEGLPRLYFEIREDGKPVDPVRYLPRK